ncbi:MAG: hypothetical protein JWM06_1554 [Actinomycetia bacterium]|nr:hypothetical protein [Actinomycetes bacterium]
MQRWEYRVVSLRDRQYTAALNEFGRDGWELVSVTSEAVEATSPGRSGAIPLPRVLGRLEEAADKLTKLGTADPDAEAPTGATSRLLWIFRRPLSDD